MIRLPMYEQLLSSRFSLQIVEIVVNLRTGVIETWPKARYVFAAAGTAWDLFLIRRRINVKYYSRAN